MKGSRSTIEYTRASFGGNDSFPNIKGMNYSTLEKVVEDESSYKSKNGGYIAEEIIQSDIENTSYGNAMIVHLYY